MNFILFPRHLAEELARLRRLMRSAGGTSTQDDTPSSEKSPT